MSLQRKLFVFLLMDVFLILTLGACFVSPGKSIRTQAFVATESLPSPIQFDTLVQAQERASFPLLAPQASLLPKGFTLTSVEYWPQRQNATEAVIAYYSDDHADLSITETLTPEGITPPNLTYQTVQIRGHEGYLTTAKGEPVAYALIWEENGVSFIVSSSGLTREELFEIAEGMHPLK